MNPNRLLTGVSALLMALPMFAIAEQYLIRDSLTPDLWQLAFLAVNLGVGFALLKRSSLARRVAPWLFALALYPWGLRAVLYVYTFVRGSERSWAFIVEGVGHVVISLLILGAIWWLTGAQAKTLFADPANA